MQVAPNQWHLSDKSTAGKRWNPGRKHGVHGRSSDEDFLRAISTPHRGRGLAGLLLLELVLGHFILLLGAALLDDLPYDPIRKATRAKQIERLAKGGGPSSAWQRFLARLIIKKDSDETSFDQCPNVVKATTRSGSLN